MIGKIADISELAKSLRPQLVSVAVWRGLPSAGN